MSRALQLNGGQFMKKLLAVGAVLIMLTLLVTAQTGQSPYAGEESRRIKSLSQAEGDA